MMRIGHGYDVHRLVRGRRLILGGVDIPHETAALFPFNAHTCTVIDGRTIERTGETPKNRCQ